MKNLLFVTLTIISFSTLIKSMDQNQVEKMIWFEQRDHALIQAISIINSKSFDKEKLQQLLNNNPSIIYDRDDLSQGTLLSYAVTEYSLEAVAIILSKSNEKSLNIKNSKGWTPFALAVHHSRFGDINKKIMQLFAPKLSKSMVSEVLSKPSNVQTYRENSEILLGWLNSEEFNPEAKNNEVWLLREWKLKLNKTLELSDFVN